MIVRNLSNTTFAYRGRAVAPGEAFFDTNDPCAAVTELVRVRNENPGEDFAVTQEVLDFLVQCPQLKDDPSALVPPDPVPPPAPGDPPPPAGNEETNESLKGVVVAPRDTFGADPSEPPVGPPPAGGARTERSRDEEKDRPQSGDPVDLFSGEFVLEKIDFELPSRGFPFVLRRSYRSGRPFWGPFGFNWDHNYNIHLRKLDGAEIAINTGNLHEDVYVDAGDGVTFDAPRGVHARLRRLDSFSPEDYLLEHQDGFRWIFGRPPGWSDPERIPLLEVRDARGNAQALAYDGQSRLAAVTDTVGRRISFVYGDCGLLEGLRPDFLQSAGAPPVQIQYLHAATVEHLSGVVTFPTPDFPDGLTTTYEYDTEQADPAMRHNIVRVVDAAGRTVVENIYGTGEEDGDFNRVVRQYFQGGEHLYRYRTLRPALPFDEYINDAQLQVEIREPERPLRVATFNFRGNLLDERFRLCLDGSYRLWARAYRYNRHGDLTEAFHPDGTATRHVYDEGNPDPLARGNLLRIEALSQPNHLLTRVVRRFTYEPRFQRVKTVTEEGGPVTTFVYDYDVDPARAHGNVVKVLHPDAVLPDGTAQNNSVTSFVYDPNGQVIERVSPEGRRQTFTYHTAGPGAGQVKLMTWHDPDAPLTQSLEYDDLGRICRRIDAGGNEYRYVYDLLGQLVHTESPAIAGRRAIHKFEYNQDGRLAREFLPRGAYADSVLTGEWIINEFAYDVASWLVRERRFANTETPQDYLYERDVHGNLTRLVDPLLREHRFEYDERNLLLRETRYASSPHPLVTTYRYDRAGNVTRIDRPDGTRIAHDFSDPFGRLRSATDRFGVTRTFTYGDRDLVQEMKIADAQGSLLYAKGYAHDSRDRLIGTDLGGIKTRFFHDRDGLRVEVTDSTGARHRRDFDGIGRLRCLTDAAGWRNRASYNAAGNMTSLQLEYTPSGGGVASLGIRLVYDARNRPIESSDPLGNVTRTAYDDRNLTTTVTNSLGNKARVDYDVSGQAIRSWVQTPTGPERLLTTWERDTLGRLRAHVDAAGRRTGYEHDDRDNIVRIVRPGGTQIARTFDPLGRLSTETDANGTVTRFTYSPLGRLESLDFQHAPPALATDPVTFAYDSSGRLTRVVRGGHAVDLRYDPLGRVAEERQSAGTVRRTIDDLTRSVHLEYPDGRRDTMTTDAVGRISTLTFDRAGGAGLLAGDFAAGTVLARYDYEGPFLVAKRLANGTSTSFRYESSGLLGRMEVRDAAGTLVDGQSYLYDGEKKRRLVLRHAPLPANRLFTYDELGRLRRADFGFPAPAVPPQLPDQPAVDAFLQAVPIAGAAGSEVYTVADGGERTSWSDGGMTRTPSYGAALEILSVTNSDGSQATYGYDANGNRVLDDRYLYRYDAMDQLIEVVRRSDGATALRQEFDGLGRVVRRQSLGGAVRSLLYDGLRCLQENAAQQVVAQTAFGGILDECVAVSTAGATRFVHQNPALDSVATSSRSGAVEHRYDFSPFGAPRLFSAAGDVLDPSQSPLPPLFGGRPLLPPGFYDNRKRQYDPTTGLFFQRDPLGCVDGGHEYLYAHHDPVNQRDALGLLGYTHSPYVAMTEDEKQNLGKFLGDTAFGIANAFTAGAPARIAAQENLGTMAGLEESGYIGLTALFNVASFGFYEAIRGGISDAQNELFDMHFQKYGETAGDDPEAAMAYRLVGTVGGALMGSAKHIASLLPIDEIRTILSDPSTTAQKLEAAFYGISKVANLAALGAGVSGRNPTLAGPTAKVGYGATGVGQKGLGHGSVTVFNAFFDKNGNGVIRFFAEKQQDYRVPEMNPRFYGGKFTYAEHTIPLRAAKRAMDTAVARYTKTNLEGKPEAFSYARANCSHFASEVLAEAGIQLVSTFPKVAYWNFKIFPYLGGTLMKTSALNEAIQATERKK